MPYTDAYFTLRWNSESTSKYFRMQLADSNPHAYLMLATFSRSLDADLLEVAPAASKRMVEGIVRVGESEPTGWGTIADLESAFEATDLECKMYGDAAFWDARWTMPWGPSNIDPLGNYLAVPMRLEER
jgi:hypothetical protein